MNILDKFADRIGFIEMNVKDYKYIVEIANQENISRAAALLYITQSALTKFLQRVEEELGAPLFFRQGNRMILTEIGQCYVEMGRKIIELDYEAEKEISRMVEEKNRYIRIGYSFGRADYITEAVLVPFLKKYSGIQVSVQIGSTSSRLKMVEDNKMDLAIVTSKDYHPNLIYHQVGKVPLVLAVPRDSHLLDIARQEDGLKYPAVELADWIEEPFVQLSTLTNSGQIVREFFKKEHVKPNVCLEINDVRSGMKAVESGIGNSIFWAVSKKGREVEYLSMKELNPPVQQMYVVYRSDFYISPAVSQLIRLIENAFRE